MPSPLAHPGSDKPRGDHRSWSRRLPSTGTHWRPAVLIVEDDEDTRELYSWCLRASGWLVEAVVSGEEALSVAAEFEPDVIVMDLLLPLISGLEAARQLKADPRTAHIPIVAISGIDVRRGEALATEAGCAAYVAKPYPPAELRALLESVVTRRGGPP